MLDCPEAVIEFRLDEDFQLSAEITCMKPVSCDHPQGPFQMCAEVESSALISAHVQDSSLWLR